MFHYQQQVTFLQQDLEQGFYFYYLIFLACAFYCLPFARVAVLKFKV